MAVTSAGEPESRAGQEGRDIDPESIDLVDPELYAHGDPYPVWAWLRLHEPVYRHRATTMPSFWAITRYDDVKAVYRDHETFSSAQGILLRPASQGSDPGGGRTMALTDPPRHHQLRSLVDRWFTTRAVRGMDGGMRSVAGEVVERALRLEECDFVADIAARLPLYVICRLMGIPAEDREFLFQLTSQAFGAGDANARSIAHQEIIRYFIGLIEKRRRAPANDLVSMLVHGRVEGRPLTIEDILLNCDNLLVGGTENVRLATAGGMQAFIEHPEQWRSLGTSPDLMASAVEEILRWTSSATHIMRTATRRVRLHGRTIEEGDRVVLWNPSANRDSQIFQRPDRFDITRQPNRHLALGAGRHFCIGSVLARAEMSALFSELRRQVGRVEPTGPAVRLSSIVVNGLEKLPVRLHPAVA
ncbi:cytochrome P450 [Streptosporangium sp. CA-115845]|uniref:cytochrome P450 n=1 Tax=Streptosporangium sp. CA-115845 TaxID=3240071 RepID=UPI003D8ECA95